MSLNGLNMDFRLDAVPSIIIDSLLKQIRTQEYNFTFKVYQWRCPNLLKQGGKKDQLIKGAVPEQQSDNV